MWQHQAQPGGVGGGGLLVDRSIQLLERAHLTALLWHPLEESGEAVRQAADSKPTEMQPPCVPGLVHRPTQTQQTGEGRGGRGSWCSWSLPPGSPRAFIFLRSKGYIKFVHRQAGVLSCLVASVGMQSAQSPLLLSPVVPHSGSASPRLLCEGTSWRQHLLLLLYRCAWADEGALT